MKLERLWLILVQDVILEKFVHLVLNVRKDREVSEDRKDRKDRKDQCTKEFNVMVVEPIQ